MLNKVLIFVMFVLTAALSAESLRIEPAELSIYNAYIQEKQRALQEAEKALADLEDAGDDPEKALRNLAQEEINKFIAEEKARAGAIKKAKEYN